jgi:hypothetical protein
MNDDDFAELFKKLPSSSSGTSWQDVRAELTLLGKTVGDVLRTAWERSESEPIVRQMRESVESAIADLDHAAEGSPETRQARDQLMRLAEAIRSAAETAGEQVRPELLSLLRQANGELRRFTDVDDDRS